MIRDLPTWIHFAFLATALLGILLADSSAFAWMRGNVDTVHRKTVFRLHWIVTVGLSGLILSGLYLFWPLREYLVMQPLFWLKMFFVVTLLVNSFFVERLMQVATERPYSSLTAEERLPLYISGAISTLCWLGAITVAILLFKWPFV
jgi:hypothetical protein